MTNIVFSPALQAPITLSNPTGAVTLASDPSSSDHQSNPIPNQGAVSLIGAAVRLALAVSTHAGAASMASAAPTVVSGLVTPRSPIAGSFAVSGTTPTLTVGGGGPVLTFPRVMLVAVGGDQSYGSTSGTGWPKWTTATAGSAANTAIQKIGAYDIAILGGSFEGWDSNGQRDRENLTQALLKAAATYTVTLSNSRRCLPFYYQMMMSGIASGGPYQQFFTLVQNNNWWLYQSAGGTGTITPAGGGLNHVNYSAAWPGAIGSAGAGSSICGSNYGTTSSGSPTGAQGPARTMGNYAALKLLIRNSAGVDSRFTFNAQMASPSCGGIFLDNCFVALDGSGSVPNSSLDGITIAPGSQQGGGFPALDTVQPVMARGNRNMLDQLQTMAATYQPTSTFYNFANFGQYANAYQFGKTALVNAGLDNLHGGLLESVLGAGLQSWECFQTGNPATGLANLPSGWQNLKDNYYAAMDFCLAPKLVGLGCLLPSTDGVKTSSWPVGAGTTPTTVTTGTALEFQLMRYGLCTALLDNGYFAPGCSGYDYANVRWYDEYGDDSLTQVNVKRGYLGTPLTARPTSPTWNQGTLGVWSRAFTNGIAIVNPRGNGPQTVSLPSFYQKLVGTQQPSLNNGAVLNSVSLADGDGIVLLTASGQLASGHWVTAKTGLDLVYPRPDTETNTYARHRWAYYDGVNPFQYSISIGVRGGAAPYWFQLVSGPPGMVVGTIYGSTNYGIVTWTPIGSVTSASCIVRVHDQDGNSVDVTWTVSTSSSTAQFVFFSTTGNDSTGTGTINSPYATLAKCLGSSNGSSTFPNAIAVFRGGTYNAPANGFVNVGKTPMGFIAYPGESVTFNLGTTTGDFSFMLPGGGHDFTWQGIGFTGGNHSSVNFRSFIFDALSNRISIQGLAATSVFNGTSGGDVTTSLFFNDPSTGTYRQYLYLCDCSETGRTNTGGNAYALTTLYNVQHGLIERCQVTSTATHDIYLKASVRDTTVRYCSVSNLSPGSGSSVATGCQVDNGAQTVNVEFCYNTFVTANPNYTLSLNYGFFTPGIHWVYRNTLMGSVQVRNALAGSGPYVLDSNVIVFGSATAVVLDGGTASVVQNSGTECQGLTSVGIVDGNHLLTGTYRTNYRGLRGAEIA